MDDYSPDHALIEAARRGDTDQCRELLMIGASPNFRLSNGTALHDAIRNGYVEVCRILLESGASCDVAANFLQFHALDIAIVESGRNDSIGREIFELIFQRQTDQFFNSTQRMKFSFWLACSESHCLPFDTLLPVLHPAVFFGQNRQQSLFNAAALGYNFHIVLKLVRYGLQLPAAFRPPRMTNKSNAMVEKFRKSCNRLYVELRSPTTSLQSLCRRKILALLPVGYQLRHTAIFDGLDAYLPHPVKCYLEFSDFEVCLKSGYCGCSFN